MFTVFSGMISYVVCYWLLKDYLPYDERSKQIIPSQPVDQVVKRNMALFFVVGPIMWYLLPDIGLYVWDNSIFKFILCILITDIWFYFTHRLLHTKFFYRWHKQHHQFYVAYPIVALYASPVEAIVCDAMSAGLGPALLKLTFFEFQCWMIFMAIYSLILHSKLKPGNHHTVHHGHNAHNYGLFCIIDRIIGTYH